MFSLPFGVAVIFTGEVMLNCLFWPYSCLHYGCKRRVYFWFYRERHWKWETIHRHRRWRETAGFHLIPALT